MGLEWESSIFVFNRAVFKRNVAPGTVGKLSGFIGDGGSLIAGRTGTGTSGV